MFPTATSRYIQPLSAAVGDIAASSKLLVPGRVISSTRIPQGCLSMPINPKMLKGNTEIVQISVGANSYGTMELEEGSKSVWNRDVHWVRALRLADDCHSYNIQLRKLPHHSSNLENEEKPKLVLQAVRSVEPGQELLLWFSEDILATLHMGFLTPANIQGQKNYVCTRCSALYESPNPLKLHLTLGCGKFSMTTLWDKLSMALQENEHRTGLEFKFRLVPESSMMCPKQKIAIDLSTPAEKKIKQENLFKPYNTYSNSAFKPFQKIENRIENNNVTPLMQWPRFNMPQDYVHTPVLGQNCDDEAQIETLVSSLGKYKEGHICLYCGKSYSRKYGLKIHIRTHTGYKPLKCKFCLRPFGDPSNLNKHVRLHAEGDTPYKCDLCGKVLVRRRDLERHLKSRHMNEINPVTSVITDEESNGTSLEVSDEDENISVDN
ncbi:PREDICTED: PR domain zinc finger protein 16 [Nicrophorus vespilloides]|uniref:PR domain zinc finger protein 16 n=1 Tax=Nicrophorus vespilloides TaxID=110193 RepID=A0ABM1NEG7_NICVS|nr:PREDICTED: PR domain zinc finger protein 16 [Nicrophorus vespilloides]